MALEYTAEEDKKRRQQDSAGIDRMIGGALSVPVAVARDAANNIGTDIANLGRAAIGGQTKPRPGYPHTNSAIKRTAEGAQAFGEANSNLLGGIQSGLRDLTGTEPARQPVAAQVQPAERPSQQAAASSMSLAALPIGIAAPAVAPKTAAPAAAIAQPSAAPVMPDNASITINGQAPKSIGDGIGAFSQMQSGDSRAALDEFARANAIRGQAIKESQRGELGNNGGKLTIVRDSSRAPSIAELQNARLESAQARTESQRAAMADGQVAASDARQESALTRSKAEQDLGIGAIQLQNAQQLQQIAQQLADPGLSTEERRALTEQYQAMSGKTPENRFTVAPGGQEVDPTTGALVTRPSRIFNNQTGQFVEAQQAPAIRTQVSRAEVEQTAKARGMTADQVIEALKAKGVSVNG